jgi:O-antigen/teichoic acid export membrane protein
MTTRIGGMGVTLALVALGAPLAPALLGFPLGGLVMVAVGVLALRRFGARPALASDLRGVLDTLRAARPFGASELLYLLYARVDLMLLAWLSGEATAGIYAAAIKFLEVAVMPAVFLGLAAYPTLSRAHRDAQAELLLASSRLLVMALGLTLLIGWGLFFVVPLLVPLLLGAEFAPASTVVRGMTPLVVLVGVETVLWRLFLAAHLQVRMFQLKLAAAVFNVTLNLALIPWLGIPGAVLTSLLMLVLLDAGYLYVLSRRVPVGSLLRTLRFGAAWLGAAASIGTLASLSGSPWLPALGSLAALLSFPLLVHPPELPDRVGASIAQRWKGLLQLGATREG